MSTWTADEALSVIGTLKSIEAAFAENGIPVDLRVARIAACTRHQALKEVEEIAAAEKRWLDECEIKAVPRISQFITDYWIKIPITMLDGHRVGDDIAHVIAERAVKFLKSYNQK